MNQTEYLPCPFCGFEVTDDNLDMDNDRYWTLYCPCGVRLGNYENPDDITSHWNSRTELHSKKETANDNPI